jgi:DnaJ-class molecular chaperone
MRPSVKAKPLAVCSVCHALSNLHQDLNHRCHKSLHGRRCYGTFKSGMAYLWDRCESCEGTGEIGSQECSACRGFGWTMYA